MSFKRQAISVGMAAEPTGSLTRPANTTAYASGQLVANSTVAGSVTPLSISVARTAAGSGVLRRLRLRKTSANITNAIFRIHLFNVAPTVAAGDGGALSMSGAAGYLGQADITVGQAFTDGSAGFSDSTFSDLQLKLASGQVIYALIEARGAYTPASAETFTVTAEMLQD